MQICAIICEYNPFHNGHAYQIKKARELSGCDTIMCIMSGNFVQRGQPAIIDKFSRAQMALNCGADIVIELQTVFATSSAEIFAKGGVLIASTVPDVKYLSMGVESSDINLFHDLISLDLESSEAFKSELKVQLKLGNTYAKSYTLALQNHCRAIGIKDLSEVLTSPNNLLAYEYIKALRATNILPLPVPREGCGYHDKKLRGEGETMINCDSTTTNSAKLTPSNKNTTDITNFASATAIRENILDWENLRKFMPLSAYELLHREINFMPNHDAYSDLVVHSIRQAELSYLHNLLDAREGIENKLYANALTLTSLDDIISKTKSKRYTLSTVRRLALQALLGITKDIATKALLEQPYLKVLGVSDIGKELLPQLAKLSLIKNTDEHKLSEVMKQVYAIDKRAANIYSLITRKSGNQVYCNRFLTT